MKLKPLMIQGTGSHVGKSFLVMALCRIFLRRGIEVVPFKAQNMANNAAAVTGGEIGRAQALQAAAARIDPDVRMNPLLLKPSGNKICQAVLMGKPVGSFTVKQLDRKKPAWFKTIQKAYHSLAAENDATVIEGAGSPAEINLREADYANMRVAQMADAQVILVGDIDRGGVFAALHGTQDLLLPVERKRIVGLCINKFRGDASLLDSGIRFLRQKTGKPVMGVIPYDTNLRLPEEDSLGLNWRSSRRSRRNKHSLEIGLVHTPHIANFTDFDPFQVEPDVVIRDVHSPRDLEGLAAVILPGSKNVFGDMRFLNRSGLANAIRTPADFSIVGICGGLQLLGRTIIDSIGVEDRRPARMDGLGLLPVHTRFFRKKIVRPVVRRHRPSRSIILGYEIHHGIIYPDPDDRRVARPLFHSENGSTEGCISPDGRILGTLTHGVFDSDKFRAAFLNRLRKHSGLPERPAAEYDLEKNIDRAADLVSSHLDVNAILRLLKID